MAKRVGKTDDQPFVKLFRELTYRWTPWEVWQDFVTMYACAISNAVDKFLNSLWKWSLLSKRIRSKTSSEVSSWHLTSAMTPAGSSLHPTTFAE